MRTLQGLVDGNRMTMPNSETALLNFYRASQLHGGLILGQAARCRSEAQLILSLTRHSAEELIHAQLWTETIIAIGGRPAPLRATYHARHAAAVGAPATLLEVLALTHMFERRQYRHFAMYVRIPGVHPAVAATFRRTMERERGHIRWVKSWLSEQSRTCSAEVRKIMKLYSLADQRMCDTLSNEFGSRWAA